MSKSKHQDGFTLIELVIVIAIISILSATAIPAYVGMQERGRDGCTLRAASTVTPELQAWLHSVRRGGAFIEVDTNGDGTIAPPDLNNNTLATTGVVTAFVAAKTESSPWDRSSLLWTNGNMANTQAACDAAASANAGQITLCYTPDEDRTIRHMFISASNGAGNIIYQKTITAD